MRKIVPSESNDQMASIIKNILNFPRKMFYITTLFNPSFKIHLEGKFDKDSVE